MSFAKRKEQFDRNNPITESCLVAFKGVCGFDVYNPSIPFVWENERYIFGRLERREEWARSWARLFKETAPHEFSLVENGMIYQLEDPFVSKINGELVMGGTHVRYKSGEVDTYYDYFYKGKDINNLYYFATGPDYMKDIRLVQLSDGIGVFSRPRNSDVEKEHGSGSYVGFIVIKDLIELTAERIESAKKIDGMFADGEWGGCNQCYLLDSGLIGLIGHKSYETPGDSVNLSIYVAVSFVFDPKANKILDEKIIATRNSFPAMPAKKSNLTDCIFPSGIIAHSKKADLYAGLGDTCVGRAVIDYPFEGFGAIVNAYQP